MPAARAAPATDRRQFGGRVKELGRTMSGSLDKSIGLKLMPDQLEVIRASRPETVRP